MHKLGLRLQNGGEIEEWSRGAELDVLWVLARGIGRHGEELLRVVGGLGIFIVR
jgi:hypothetical protein